MLDVLLTLEATSFFHFLNLRPWPGFAAGLTADTSTSTQPSLSPECSSHVFQHFILNHSTLNSIVRDFT